MHDCLADFHVQIHHLSFFFFNNFVVIIIFLTNVTFIISTLVHTTYYSKIFLYCKCSFSIWVPWDHNFRRQYRIQNFLFYIIFFSLLFSKYSYLKSIKFSHFKWIWDDSYTKMINNDTNKKISILYNFL